MEEDLEILKIGNFLSGVQPIVVEYVRTILKPHGFEIQETGSGLNISLSIKSKGKEVTFCLCNLLLEIATVDRDTEPLKFDERILDFPSFLLKLAHLTEAKLRILFCILEEDNPEAAIKRIEANSAGYERILICHFDDAKPNEG